MRGKVAGKRENREERGKKYRRGTRKRGRKQKRNTREGQGKEGGRGKGGKGGRSTGRGQGKEGEKIKEIQERDKEKNEDRR